MKPIISDKGERVDGLFRDASGAIVVVNPDALAKYKRILEREQEIQKLSDQVASLTSIVQELMNKMERNNG